MPIKDIKWKVVVGRQGKTDFEIGYCIIQSGRNYFRESWKAGDEGSEIMKQDRQKLIVIIFI